MGIFFPFLYCVYGVKHGGRLTMEKITWDFRLRISRSHVRLAPGRRENQLVKSLQFFLLDDDEDDGVFLPRLAMSVSIFTFYSAMYKKKKNLFRRLSPSLRHRPPAAIRPERIPSVLVARVDVHAYRVLPFAWRKSIDIVRRVVRSSVSHPCVWRLRLERNLEFDSHAPTPEPYPVYSLFAVIFALHTSTSAELRSLVTIRCLSSNLQDDPLLYYQMHIWKTEFPFSATEYSCTI